MCQDPTTSYICGHTIRGPRITCGRPWAAPLPHIIRATSATLPTPCPPCSKSAPALVYPSVPPPPYSSTVVSLPTPPVAAPQIRYQYRSTPRYPYPTYTSPPIYQYQYPPQIQYQTPYIFQPPPYIHMPGPGSLGTPLPVPDNVPREVRWEPRSNGTYHQVVHYHFSSAPNPIPVATRGYNTFHGFDTGSLPPGWGPAGAPLPLPVIGSTPRNIIPPNMILGIPAPASPAVTAPVPPNSNPSPQVTPAVSGTPAPAPVPPNPNDTVAAAPTLDTSAESSTVSLTETSTDTSGSSTSTSTSGTSTPTSDSRPTTPNTGRARPAVGARVRFSPDTRGGST